MSKQTSTYQRLTVILLALALLAPMLYSLHFYGERMAHRMYMWYETKHNNLETLELDSAAIQWTKRNRELIINGEYFDIVSIEYHKGKATIKGIFDHKETEMHEAFAAATENNNDNDHTTQQIADWLQTGWLGSHFDFFFAYPLLQSKNLSCFTGQFLPFYVLNIPHPPPWHSA